MSETTHPTSVRLSKETLALLDQRARETKRSRSFLVEQALKRHLMQPASPETDIIAKRIEKVLSFKGAGAKLYGPLTAEQIERRAREFGRDDD